ncbi:agmatine deiminase family protein [Aspergillus ruber CBS 135680]|uniref:Peptidyl-arginine deiminase domain protein n=1 Tax=Aspergillus ruber (strain CBS 135680) TaxID=1388766 RepID=A0A017SKR3_ASPRC|nr:uncharacterized protein EURHEDRAFT_450632 [Aspergillus ruber CBS 135680]EYE97517.1 hypothetical protein EURHEDRAFT_450632 [Aspergillus ruber CBS 135680]
MTLFYPAETAPHKATILGFPSSHAVPRELLNQTRNEIMDLAVVISEFEPVRVHVRPEDENLARQILNERFQKLEDININNKTKKAHKRFEDIPQYQLSRITFHKTPTNHPWVRDTGPVYVLDKTNSSRRIAIDFGFCEWGGKNSREIDVRNEPLGQESDGQADERSPVSRKGYAAPDIRHWENARFAKRVLEQEFDIDEQEMNNGTKVERVVSPLRLEGGALEVDGEGTFLATESSIICPHRNPSSSLSTRDAVESHLRALLGVSKIIWFPGRTGLDITDCHVDGEVKFIEPGVVVQNKPHPKTGKVEMEIYKEIKAILGRETDAQGRKIRVVELEAADPDLVEKEQEEAAGTYVNFYFVNGGLIVPAFGDGKRDRKAVETLRALVSPERKIRQVYVSALPLMGGVVHCVTQQVI